MRKPKYKAVGAIFFSFFKKLAPWLIYLKSTTKRMSYDFTAADTEAAIEDFTPTDSVIEPVFFEFTGVGTEDQK